MYLCTAVSESCVSSIESSWDAVPRRVFVATAEVVFDADSSKHTVFTRQKELLLICEPTDLWNKMKLLNFIKWILFHSEFRLSPAKEIIVDGWTAIHDRCPACHISCATEIAPVLAHPSAAGRPSGLHVVLLFCLLTISVWPIMSKSTGPIFAKYSG